MEGKAAGIKSKWQTERRAAGEEREKNTSPQNKILFLSFSFLCCFPLKERKKRDKNKLKEVGGCREAGLQGRQQDVLDILLSPAGDSETG